MGFDCKVFIAFSMLDLLYQEAGAGFVSIIVQVSDVCSNRINESPEVKLSGHQKRLSIVCIVEIF